MGGSSSKTVCNMCGRKSVRATVSVTFRMDGQKQETHEEVCTHRKCGYKSKITRTLVTKEEAAAAGVTQDQVFGDIRAAIHGDQKGSQP